MPTVNAPHRDLSDATLRSDLAPRRSPSACAEGLLKKTVAKKRTGTSSRRLLARAARYRQRRRRRSPVFFLFFDNPSAHADGERRGPDRIGGWASETSRARRHLQVPSDRRGSSACSEIFLKKRVSTNRDAVDHLRARTYSIFRRFLFCFQ